MKTFQYEENGLSYTVTLTQGENGTVSATITVNSGYMDVNAFYWGDSDHSVPSAGLGGPLNMNGAGSQYDGERVQWDGAQPLSRPGLGREGTDKETFLGEGQSLGPITLDGVSSLDEIDFFGVRATSTSTPEGSIKGVSVPCEEHDEPDHPDEPDHECGCPVKDEADYPTLPEGTAYVQFVIGEVGAEGTQYHDIILPEEDGPYGFLDYYEELLARLDIEDPDCDADISKAIAWSSTEGDRVALDYWFFEPGDDGAPLPLLATEGEPLADGFDTEDDDLAEVA